MSSKEILLVEHEQHTAALLSFGLACAGFNVVGVGSAHAARQRLEHSCPDLLMVESKLPDDTGLAVAQAIRSSPRNGRCPIIMLSGRSSRKERIKALEGGADDYLIKPLAARELVARIHALLRRNASSAEENIRVNALVLEPANHSVCVGEQHVHVPKVEYRLLEFFMRNPDRVHSRPALARIAWDAEIEFEERTIDVHIGRLRKALGAVGMDHLLQTVRGFGYRLTARAG